MVLIGDLDKDEHLQRKVKIKISPVADITPEKSNVNLKKQSVFAPDNLPSVSVLR